jgi:hypothetical protein
VILGLYLAGYCVSVVLMVRNWFRNFGPEFEGVCWAMFGSFLWPVLAIPWLVYQALKRIYK